MKPFLRQLLLTAILAFGSAAQGGDYAVTLAPVTNGATAVYIGGDLFTVHHSRDADRPFFYPVLGPSGSSMTRQWPMAEVEGEERDHRHHRGLWYAHGDLNGHDFWSEGAGPTITQVRAEILPGGALVTENRWVDAEGTTLCSDRRHHRFSAGKGYRQLDLSVTLVASAGRLVMGDTKEGSMAIRVPATMRVRGELASGSLVTSEGKRDGAAWGTRARWCSSLGPVGGRTVGITIMDHPSNPRHPTWWHARTYGLMAANAVGQHHFEKKPDGSGDLVVEAGDFITFRYRILFHEGDTETAEVEGHYRHFSKQP